MHAIRRRRDAGVVDQDVDRLRRAERRDQHVDRSGITDVHFERAAAPAGCRDLRCRLAGAGNVAIGADHLRAETRERRRENASEAGRGARHQRDFAAEVEEPLAGRHQRAGSPPALLTPLNELVAGL
jgi:hypothetical protein